MKIIRTRIHILIIGVLVATPLIFLQADDAKLFEKVGPGMITLVATGEGDEIVGQGAGYYITEDLVATNYHLISRAVSVDAQNHRGRRVRVDGIVAVNKGMNTALIQTRGRTAPLASDTDWEPEKGARVVIIGADESGQLAHREGKVRAVHQLDPDRRFFEIEASVPESFSGGVVLAENGMVVAMMSAMERGVRIGIPSGVVQRMPRTDPPTAFKNRRTENYFDTMEGTFFTGQAAFLMNEILAARIHLEKAVRIDPKQTDIHATLASVYLDQRDLSAAISSYQRVIELDPKRTDAHIGLGSVFIRMNRFADAVGVLEKARTHEPRNMQILLDLGGAYLETQDFTRAAETFEAYLDLKPEMAWPGYQKLGQARMSLEDYDKAIEAFAQAAALSPEDPDIALSLAEAYQKAGRLDKAEETFAKMASANPDEAKSYYGRILRMYDEANQPEKAIEAARTIMELDPEDVFASYNLGLMYQRIDRFKDAIEAFRKSLEVKPDFTSAWFNIGSCHMQLKNWPETVRAYTRFTELAPDDPNGWMGLGIGHMQQKNFREALNAFEKSVDIQPHNAAAQFNMGICYINLNDHYSAREVLKLLQELDRNLAERLRKALR